MHNETFKFLGGLNRAENKAKDDEEQEDNQDFEEKKDKKAFKLPSIYVIILFLIKGKIDYIRERPSEVGARKVRYGVRG